VRLAKKATRQASLIGMLDPGPGKRVFLLPHHTPLSHEEAKVTEIRPPRLIGTGAAGSCLWPPQYSRYTREDSSLRCIPKHQTQRRPLDTSLNQDTHFFTFAKDQVAGSNALISWDRL